MDVAESSSDWQRSTDRVAAAAAAVANNSTAAIVVNDVLVPPRMMPDARLTAAGLGNHAPIHCQVVPLAVEPTHDVRAAATPGRARPRS